ncbi:MULTISPECIES: DUF5357 family protein [Planktothricoides]|uniref:DUF5357 family protein n=2 Tax=Planktothricoides raciborskii TaxID=132608 RepID=A0AAU8J8W0_9CYAN|nr:MULTISPECIES: DUF5357 family protein [Planktothricoides]MBD2543197.1 DUF5357 family protein [Planktothricoides raciborskii FACHB-1370]MBD2580887.1 DUF5357 family protein [Planktothricoides raciborskii FACHB-1261]
MSPIFQQIKDYVNLFKPPKAISWQTIILLSMFSGLFAFFAYILPGNNGIIAANFTANFALLFLIIGVFWLLTEKRSKFFGIKLRPIIVSLLICVFLFKTIEINFVFVFGQFAPILCGLMAIIPEFFNNFKPKQPQPEKLKELINIFLIYLLISCWFTFYVFIQNWAEINYPKNFYINQNFSQSFFVVQTLPIQDKSFSISSKISEDILNYFEVYLNKQLNAKPWSRVEAYLKMLNSQYLKNKINQVLINQIEDSQWSVRLEVEPIDGINPSTISEYNLTLWVILSGNNDNPEQYKLKKTCKVRQSFINPSSSHPKAVAEFICEKTSVIQPRHNP